MLSHAVAEGNARNWQESGRFRFAVASDGHYGQPGTPWEQQHKQMMQWLNEEAAGKGLDFVIFNGDLVHDDPALLQEVKEHYQQLSVPFYVTRGNHDRATQQQWQQTWGYGTNHAFVHKNCGFVLADTSNQAGDYVCADHDWLGHQLQEFASLQRIFVFLHISHYKWTQNGIDCPEVTSLLEKIPNVEAVFHGHDHQHDNVMLMNGLSYFFDGHIGGSWGLPYQGYRVVETGGPGKTLTFQCNRAALVVNQSQIK